MTSASATPNRPEVIAFLDDIKANPLDDTPRLILADWLEERNDPRGTFLRLDTELATLNDFEEAYWELKEKRDRIWAAHYLDWLGPLNGSLDERGALGVSSDRGLFCISMPRETLLRKKLQSLADTECWAWIQTLRTGISQKGVTRLNDNPLLARISTLDLRSGSLHPNGAKDLARTSFLSGLRGLNLTSNWIGDMGVRAIRRSDNLRNLVYLNLESNKLRPDGIKALAGAALQLDELILDRNRLGNAGINALISAKWLKSVRALSLNRTGIRRSGAHALFECSRLANLRRLSIADCGLEISSARYLKKASFVANLTHLSIHENGSPVEALTEMAEVEWNNLASLDVSSHLLGAEALQILLDAPSLTGQLRALNLFSNALDDQEIVALSQSELLSQLRSLSLSIWRLSRETLKKLFTSPSVEQMLSLDFGHNGNEHLTEVLLSSKLTSLRRLYIPRVEMTPKLARRFVESSALPSLRELECATFNLSPESREILCSRFHLIE